MQARCLKSVDRYTHEDYNHSGYVRTPAMSLRSVKIVSPLGATAATDENRGAPGRAAVATFSSS